MTELQNQRFVALPPFKTAPSLLPVPIPSVLIMPTIEELIEPTGFPLTGLFMTKRLIPSTIARGDGQ